MPKNIFKSLEDDYIFPIQPIDDESSLAFDAFVIYAELGLKRTLDAAVKIGRSKGQGIVDTDDTLQNQDSQKSINAEDTSENCDRQNTEKRTRSHWEKWSKTYNWRARAREYDDWVFKRDQAEKNWLRKRTLLTLSDEIEDSLKKDLAVAELLTVAITEVVSANKKLTPVSLRTLSGAFKDVATTKATVLERYFSLLGGEEFSNKVMEEMKG